MVKWLPRRGGRGRQWGLAEELESLVWAARTSVATAAAHYVIDAFRFLFLVIETKCGLVLILKTGVLGMLYYVRSTDENAGGSVVDILGKWKYLASCTMYGLLTKTWVVPWLTYFGKQK